MIALKLYAKCFTVVHFLWKTVHSFHKILKRLRTITKDFPGGTVVKNPPANAGDTGSSPGPGRFHMPRSS